MAEAQAAAAAFREFRQLKLPPRRAVEVRTHRRLRTHVRAPGLFDLRTGWPPLLKRLGYLQREVGAILPQTSRAMVGSSLVGRKKSAMWLSLGLGLGDALLAGPGVACGKGCSYAIRVCARPPPSLALESVFTVKPRCLAPSAQPRLSRRPFDLPSYHRGPPSAALCHSQRPSRTPRRRSM